MIKGEEAGEKQPRDLRHTQEESTDTIHISKNEESLRFSWVIHILFLSFGQVFGCH